MTLEDLILRAFENNPGLAAVEELRTEVEGGVEEARAGAYPQLDAVAGWNRSRNPSLLNSPDFADFVGEGFRPQEQEIYNLGIELTQTLYSGGKISAAVDLAEVLAQMAEANIETARLDLANSVAQVYFSLLGSKDAVAAIELQENARRQNLQTVENRLELGEATRLEQLRAQAALAEVRPLLEQRRGDIQVLEAQLKALLGLPRGEPLWVADFDRDLPSPPSLVALLDWARERRPELEDLGLQVESLGLQRTIKAADGRPQIDLEGRYGHQSRLVENLDDSLFADWSLNLGVRWSFFDGGRRRGQLVQLESRERQLALQILDLKRSIEVEVEEGLTSYRSVRAGWEASRFSAEAAREARRVASESYTEGVALQVDVLDAQDQEARAELAEIEAYHRALAAGARLARAVGAVTSDLFDKISQTNDLSQTNSAVDDTARRVAKEGS
ncbi:MAG: TolC family protein [Thermoanaerobaculia bacterium]|nr:TolC family protein [Thermoanaerobaculia bacterium]